MGSSAYSALSGAVLSADLCARYASAVGLSLFLLVSVSVGDCSVGVAGTCLSQTEELATEAKIGWQGFRCCPATLGEKRRRLGSILTRRLAGGYNFAGCGAGIY